MWLESKYIRISGIVQAVGPLLGISTAFVDPTGGHPSLAILIALPVFSLNLLLAVGQIVIGFMLLINRSLRVQMESIHCWSYVAAGWFLTALFYFWQWPPFFISI
jgi:hypothetical protein